MLSLLVFVSVFIVIHQFPQFPQITVCLYLSTWLCVFIANFFGNFTFNHPTVLFVLLRTGWSISIEAKSFLAYLRRLSKKKKNNERELQAFYKRADGVTQWLHRYSDKSCCFNKSWRMLYRNFIIIKNRRAEPPGAPHLLRITGQRGQRKTLELTILLKRHFVSLKSRRYSIWKILLCVFALSWADSTCQ